MGPSYAPASKPPFLIELVLCKCDLKFKHFSGSFRVEKSRDPPLILSKKGHFF